MVEKSYALGYLPPMINKSLFFTVCIFLLTLALLVTQLYYQHQKLLKAHNWVVHTLRVKDASNELLVTAFQATADLRGYLLSGAPGFLAKYRQAVDELPPIFRQIKLLTADNLFQQKQLQKLEPILQQKLRFDQEKLEKYASGTNISREQWLETFQLAQEIRSQIDQIHSEESRLLLEREANLQKSSARVLAGNIILIAVFIVVAGFLLGSLRKQWRQRQQLVEKLSMVNSELENSNLNLQTANIALAETDRLKTEFLSAMSHELRTPLNSIIGFTGILRMGIAGALNDEQLKQLGMVQDSAQHLLHLINDLLDLSRIESGHAEVSLEPFDMRDTVTEVLAAVAPLAAKKSLTLVNQCQNMPLPIVSDRRKIYQILLNLVNNAVKFSDHGTIEVYFQPLEDRWRVCVSDEGVGINPENMASLFQAFRQIDGSARKVYEGTGLGLYLSKKMADLLDSTIEVTSTPGKGSIFCLTVPRA